MNISLSQLLEESFQIAWEYRNGRELVDLVGDELRLRDARQVAYDDVLRASNLLATMHRSLALPHAVAERVNDSGTPVVIRLVSKRV
jgi:hypothetical protein